MQFVSSGVSRVTRSKILKHTVELLNPVYHEDGDETPPSSKLARSIFLGDRGSDSDEEEVCWIE